MQVRRRNILSFISHISSSACSAVRLLHSHDNVLEARKHRPRSNSFYALVECGCPRRKISSQRYSDYSHIVKPEIIKHGFDRLLPLVSKVHALDAHNSALPVTLEHIDLKALFPKIKYRKEELLKIAVIAAVDKNNALAFGFGNGVHYRKLHSLKGHLYFFYDGIFAFKIIGVILVEKHGGFKIVFLLIGVTVVHKELAHAVVGNRVFGAFLVNCPVAEGNQLALPVGAYLYLCGNRCSILNSAASQLITRFSW